MRLHKTTIVLFIIALLFFMVGNPWLPITDPVESNYALTAKEMVVTGDWLSPQIYGQYWYDKPIMVYWLLALSFKVFGFADWAARMPSGIMGAASLALLYQMMRTDTKRRIISLSAVAIMGTSLLFWPVAHGIITDMILLFTTVGTWGYAYRGLTQDSTRAMVLAYVFAGLGVLTKGPVALVLPGLLLLVFVAYMRSWTMLKRLLSWQGLMAFVFVAGPWYLYMYLTHGMDFLNGFLGLNNITRATQSEHPENNVWWYYIALTLGAMMPWTGVFIYGLYKSVKARTPACVYCLIMGLGTVVFYSCMATKYPTYTFISIIPFSVIAAVGLVQAFKPGSSKHLEWWLIFPTLLLWLAYGVGTRFLHWGFWYLLYIFIALFGLGLIHYHLRRNRYIIPVLVAVGTMVISSIVITEGLVPLVHQRSSTGLLEAVEGTDRHLYYYNAYATSLDYYTGKSLVKIKGPADSKRSEAWEGKYKMAQIDQADLAPKLAAGEAVMIFVPKTEEKNFAQSPLASYVKVQEVLDRTTIYVNR